MKIINSRIFRVLVLLFIISFVLGIVLFFLLSEKDKLNIETSLINYINMIKTNKLYYKSGLMNSIIYNTKYITIVWLFGIVFILVFLIPFITIFKGVLMGLSISTIISSFSLKGFLYSLILMFPEVINVFLIILMSYYSILFSYKCFKTIKNDKSINLKLFIKNYVFIYLIIIGLSIVSSLIEIFISSNILKFVV